MFSAAKVVWSPAPGSVHLIDLFKDRHADVFTDHAAIADVGYGDQSRSDLLAITLPINKIGIPATKIKHYKRKMADRTFNQLQTERDEQLRNKKKKNQ